MKSSPHSTTIPMTSVTPEGKFLVALHRPSFSVVNLRIHDQAGILGHTAEGTPCNNTANFPPGDIHVQKAKPIFEIYNAFFFRGATFIDSEWADAKAQDPASIKLPEPKDCSLRRALKCNSTGGQEFSAILAHLPMPVLYGLAANSTDPEELVQLADFCCRLEYTEPHKPVGLLYIEDSRDGIRADIDDLELFETVANNPFLPDAYKEVMVLRPGVQGSSEIVGEWNEDESHVYEYLRSNSYIPWGHYAANMANDQVRYRTSDLTREDIKGMRHLYYQRIFVVLAEKMGLSIPARHRSLTGDEMEDLRQEIVQSCTENSEHPATLWGWNFGYDISASGYRLHASHQMIHQQYALVPESVLTVEGHATVPSFSCGDMVADTVERYGITTGSDFFRDFLTAIRNNSRTDRKAGEHNLVVWKDENVILFVPKAQVSQWELQLMVTSDTTYGPVGNVVEADSMIRSSIDLGILTAQKIYAGLGAKMVTSIEFSKRLGLQNGQRLLYSFLPKLPWSMGAFSEAQLRFVCGHYPEDFAVCCRSQLDNIKIT